MIVVDGWRLLFIMVLVAMPENEGVFLAYKANKASVTEAPKLSEETLQMFHENGFHGEIIARAARREEECGIVSLDYTAFTNRTLFDALEKQYQNEAFGDNKSIPYLKYREAAYKLASETARKKHLEEVSKLFSIYQNITPHYSGEGQLRFILLDAIALGIGMALVYVVYSGVKSLVNSIIYKNEVEGLEKEVMNLRMDVDKVCYPITKNADVGYLLQVIPIGEFSKDESTFSWHLLNSHYLLPANIVVGNASELPTIENPRKHCVFVSSIYLCRFKSQSLGCALGRNNRSGCSYKTVNSSNARFTIVNPLLRSSAVANRLKTVLYKKSQADVDFQHIEVKKPVFAVELPKKAEMYIGDQTIRSRITSANLTLEVKMTYPVFNETLNPIFINDGGWNTADWWRRSVVDNEGMWIAAVLATVFIGGLPVYLLYTSHLLKVETRKLSVWKIMDNHITSKQTVEAIKRIKYNYE